MSSDKSEIGAFDLSTQAGRLSYVLAQLKHTPQKLKQKEVAKKIRYHPGYLIEVKKGRRELSKKMAEAIQDLYGWRSHWLLTGEGPTRQPLVWEPHPKGALEPKGADRAYVTVPVVKDPTALRPEKLGIVNIQDMVGPDGIRERITLLNSPETGITSYATVGLRVTDDSMAPTLPKEALVILDLLETDPLYLSGRIVCSRTHKVGETLIRRLRVAGDSLFLCSENKRFGAIELDRNVELSPIIGAMVMALYV